MLLHVLPSAVHAALAGPRADDALAAIDNLLRAHHAGKHFVIFDRGAEQLHSAKLSKRAGGTLQAILDTRFETKGLLGKLDAYVEVGFGDGFDGRREERGSSRVFRRDVHSFSDFEHAGRCVLLAEDATDADIYVELARACLFARYELALRPALEPRGGGGSSLTDAYAGSVASGRWTLAIADSDRDAPGGAVGPTARALRDAVVMGSGHLFDLGEPSRNQHPPLGERGAPGCALVLHARMLENLVPLHLYEATLTPEQAATRERMSELRRLHGPGPRPEWVDHVHLKKGLRWRDVEKKRDAERGPGAGEPGRSAAHFWSGVCGSQGWTGCRQEVKCLEGDECPCVVIPPLDQRAAARALSWLQTQPASRAAELWGFLPASPVPAPGALVELAGWIVSFGFAPAAARTGT